MTVRMKRNQMKSDMVESTGQHAYFLKCPSCDYFPFPYFWYRCILSMEKAYTVRLSKLKACFVFPPMVLGWKTH